MQNGVVIFVHGFGGQDYDSKYAQAMRDRAIKVGARLDVETHDWHSGSITGAVGKNWIDAKARTPAIGVELAARVRRWAEGGRPVYLVAHSLGAQVVLHALRELGRDLRSVPAVFWLGAAVPQHQALDGIEFGETTRLYNYFSPKWDKVLANAWTLAEGGPAAGAVGLMGYGDDGSPVFNLKVQSYHSLMGGYLGVAEAIAELVLHWNGRVSEAKVNEWLKGWSTGGGPDQWDEILRRGEWIIQRNVKFGQYRAIDRGPGHRRQGVKRMLGPLLRELYARWPV